MKSCVFSLLSRAGVRRFLSNCASDSLFDGPGQCPELEKQLPSLVLYYQKYTWVDSGSLGWGSVQNLLQKSAGKSREMKWFKGTPFLPAPCDSLSHFHRKK